MLGSMLQKAREIAGLSYDETVVRLGCRPDWLIRVETGFVAAGPEEVARILTGYGVRGAAAADTVIDMARRAAAPPIAVVPRHLHHGRQAGADIDDRALTGALLGQDDGEQPVNRFPADLEMPTPPGGM
jgi:hypothetical protein